MMLKSVLRYVFDNIGSPLSSKKIADTLTSEGRKVDVKTVERYLDALIESYIIYPAQRYNVKGKQYLKTLGKYYVVDIGMRFMLLGKRNTDAGHILENVIYLELLRRGYDVYVGKLYQKEIDFVVQKGDEKIYIQVSDNITAPDTFERECRPLLQIRDAYPKMILARTRHPKYSYEGIDIYDVADWLLQE